MHTNIRIQDEMLKAFQINYTENKTLKNIKFHSICRKGLYCTVSDQISRYLAIPRYPIYYYRFTRSFVL